MDVVQRHDDLLEVDVAVAERAKIPETPRIRKGGVSAEHADGAIAVTPPSVLHMRVEDAVGKGADELDVIHALVAKVRGVVVETESLMATYRFDRTLGRSNVESDFGWVNFQREVDVQLVVGVKDRAKPVSEVLKTSVPVGLNRWAGTRRSSAKYSTR